MARIFTLKADNFARLVSVELDVKDQNVVVLKGKNRQGKSSIINAIWAACQWSDAKKHIKKPVHDDADEATITVDFGELKVQRIISPDGSMKLKVWDENGRKIVQSPQSVIDAFIGDLTFDPEAFGRETPQKRREIALNLVRDSLEVDPDEIDAQIDAIYQDRRDLNRTINSRSGELENIPDVPADTPDEIQSVDALLSELSKAQDTLRDNEEKRETLSRIQEKGKALNSEMQVLRDKLTVMTAERDTLVAVFNKAKEEVEKLVDPDIEPIREKINGFEGINENVRNKQKKAEVKSSISTLQKKADGMTEEMDGLKKKKDNALRKAKFPIEGLSVSKDDVLYQGIPFEQCSQAEQEEISFAIGSRLNPTARIMMFRNASLMDEDTLSRMKQKADELDYQIFLERVGSADDGQTGFYIENGSVVSPETAEN